eukprot:15420737-Alexandrium_andersonii.AAC.1
MQNRFTRSNLELRGSRNGLKLCPRSSRAVRSAQLFVEIPNLPMKAGLGGESEGAKSPTRMLAIRNPQIRNPRNPCFLARERPAT